MEIELPLTKLAATRQGNAAMAKPGHQGSQDQQCVPDRSALPFQYGLHGAILTDLYPVIALQPAGLTQRRQHVYMDLSIQYGCRIVP